MDLNFKNVVENIMFQELKCNNFIEKEFVKKELLSYACFGC